MSDQLIESLIYKSVRHNERLGRLESQERNSVSADAFVHACSVFQCLTGLRGFWPMSSFDENGAAFDMSEQGHALTNTHNSLYNYDARAPYVEFDGTNDYLSRADGGAGSWDDILGSEAYVAAAVRGMTVGGWFWWDVVGGAVTRTAISKAAPGDVAYYIRVSAAGATEFSVTNNGAALQTTSQAAAVATAWTFCVGRFTPSAEVKLWRNNVTSTQATAIATLHDADAVFFIGGEDNGAGGVNNPMDGRDSLCFLCAAALSDATIQALYQQTRGLFGV